MDFSFWFFLAVGAASLFGMISVATWAESRRAEREALYKHEMLKKLAEQPPDQAERVMQFLRDEQTRAEERKRRQAREGLRLAGVILLVVGAVLAFFLANLEANKPLWIVGLFPLGIGVVLLAFSLFHRSDLPGESV